MQVADASAPPASYCRKCGYLLKGLPGTTCPECGRPFDPTSPRTTDRSPWRRYVRRWTRVALSVLLIVSLLVGLPVGYVYWEWRGEQPFVEAARGDFGMGIRRRDIGPEWLRRRAGSHAYLLRRVYHLDLSAPAARSHLPRVDDLNYLDSLTLRSPTDEDLAHLPKARRVRELWIGFKGGATEAGLGHIRDMPRLEQLHLHCGPYTPPRREALETMPSLWYLSLAETPTDDAYLAEMRGMKNIRWLRLADTKITDAGMAHLVTMENLELLDLENTFVTEASLAHLKRLPRLRSLRIGFVPGDEGIAHLKECRALQYLNVGHNRDGRPAGKRTRADYERMRRELPHLKGSGPW